MKITKEKSVLWAKKILICVASLFLLGIAAAINIKTALGADPITVFYEGLSEVLKLDVGLTINILNCSLTAVIFFINRKYVHIGTVIYVFALGIFVHAGVNLYEMLSIPETFIIRLLVSLTGCLLAFVGLGGFMAVNIGIDPWTAGALIISEKTHKSFRRVKIVLDIITLGLGIWMGGTFGIVTVICAFAGGPIMQKTSELLDKMLGEVLKSKCEE